MRAYINIGQVLTVGAMAFLGYRYLRVLEKQNGIEHKDFGEWLRGIGSEFGKRYHMF